MMHRNSAAWDHGELSARVYELDKPVGRSLGGDVEFYTRSIDVAVHGDYDERAELTAHASIWTFEAVRTD